MKRNESQRRISDNDNLGGSAATASDASKSTPDEIEPVHKQRMLGTGEFDDADINEDDPNRRKRSEQPAGIGLNRIRIAPVDEDRTPGSIAHKVVQTLLVNYGLLENPEGESPQRGSEPAAMAESHINNPQRRTGTSVPHIETNKRSIQEPVTEAPSKRCNSTQRGVDVVATVRQKRLVHEYKLPNQQAYQSNRPSTNRRVLPSILLDDVNKESIPRALEHLSPDLRLDILNRKSGRVLTGENAVTVKELPKLLKKHASYEPIAPPPSHCETS